VCPGNRHCRPTSSVAKMMTDNNGPCGAALRVRNKIRLINIRLRLVLYTVTVVL